jgi:hypothetical protein
MVRQVRKEAYPKEMIKGGFTRLHAVQEGAPRLLVQRPRELECHSSE